MGEAARYLRSHVDTHGAWRPRCRRRHLRDCIVVDGNRERPGGARVTGCGSRRTRKRGSQRRASTCGALRRVGGSAPRSKEYGSKEYRSRRSWPTEPRSKERGPKEAARRLLTAHHIEVHTRRSLVPLAADASAATGFRRRAQPRAFLARCLVAICTLLADHWLCIE